MSALQSVWFNILKMLIQDPLTKIIYMEVRSHQSSIATTTDNDGVFIASNVVTKRNGISFLIIFGLPFHFK